MTHRIHSRLLGSAPLRRCQLDECRAACCLYGAWVDRLEIKAILTHADWIAPHMPKAVANPSGWFDGRQEPDSHAISGFVCHTTVLPAIDHYGGTVCVFLRTDFKCALQTAADENGDHPWRFKPFYCVLHPLDLDQQGRITLDHTSHLLAQPGSCLRPALHDTPLVETFAPELRYLLGDNAYDQIKDES
jgi:hypothetical protein